MHRSSNICDALCVDGWMCECANCLKARGKKWTTNWICDKAAHQASRHGHCSVEMILCTETAFQEAIKIYTKYPIYSDQRENELCLSITWCLLFWILGKNKFHAKERTLKRTRRIVDTFTSKQTNKRRNRVPVIGCIRHEQVLGEWSVWHWPLSQHHFYINNINNNNNSNHIQRSYDEKHS